MKTLNTDVNNHSGFILCTTTSYYKYIRTCNKLFEGRAVFEQVVGLMR